VRHVVLYHAADCHLCEEAHAAITAVRAEHAFELSEIDITGDDRLEATYRERIPVVAIDGEDVFEYIVDRPKLRRLVAPGDDL
jgi:glutaredoxin